jgi:hypothetical protein
MIKTAALTFTTVLTFPAGLYSIAPKVPPAEARIEINGFEGVDALSNAGFETPLADDKELPASRKILAAVTGQRIVYRRTIVGFHAWHAEHGLAPDDEVNGLMTRARYISFFRHFADLPEPWPDRADGRMLNMNPRQVLEYHVADVIQRNRYRDDQSPTHISTAVAETGNGVVARQPGRS